MTQSSGAELVQDAPARLNFEEGRVVAEITDRALGEMLHFNRLELYYPKLHFPLKVEKGMDDFRRRTSVLKTLSLKVGLSPLVERVLGALSGGLFQSLIFDLRPPWHASIRGLWTTGPYPSYFVLDTSLHASGRTLLIVADDIRVYSLGGPHPILLVGQLSRSLPAEWLSMASQGTILLEPLGWLCGKIAEMCGWLRHPQATDTNIEEVRVVDGDIFIEAGLPFDYDQHSTRGAKQNHGSMWLDERPESLMAEGDMQLLRGEAREAENLYMASVESRPEVLSAYTRLAQLYASLPGRMEECAEVCRRGLSRRKEFWPLELLLSLVEEARGDLQSSLSRYRRFLYQHEAEPREYSLDLLPVHFKAGQVSQRLGLSLEAREHFHKVLDLDPKAYPAMEALSQMEAGEDRWHEASAWLQKAIAETEQYDDRPRIAEFLRSAAQIQIRGHENQSEAIKILNQAVKMDQHCYAAWQELSSLEMEKGRYKRAKGHLRKAYELAKDSEELEAEGQLALALGSLLFAHLSQREEGMELVMQSARLLPDSEPVWAKVVELGEAETSWEIVAEGYLNLGRIQSNRGDSHTSSVSYLASARVRSEHLEQRVEALEAYQAASEQDPDLLEAWTQLVSLCSLEGRWEDAATAHEQVARISQREGRAEEAARSMFLAGEILRVELSNSARALSCYTRALDIAPNQLDARKALGTLLYTGKRDPAGAFPHLSTAVHLDPMDTETVEELAHVCRELSKWLESRQLFSLLGVLEGKERKEVKDLSKVQVETALSPPTAPLAFELCEGPPLRGPLGELYFTSMSVLERPLFWYALPPLEEDAVEPLPAEELEVFERISSLYVKKRRRFHVEGFIRSGKGKGKEEGSFVRTERGLGLVLPRAFFRELPAPCRQFMWGKLLWHVGRKTYSLYGASQREWVQFLDCIKLEFGLGKPIKGDSSWAELAKQLRRRMKRKTKNRCKVLLGSFHGEPDVDSWMRGLTQASDRAGLLACRDIRWALRALLWSRGLPWPLASSRMTLLQSLRKKKDPEFKERIVEFCQYATSEAYFEAWGQILSMLPETDSDAGVAPGKE